MTEQYLNFHKNAWAPSTLKLVRKQLRSAQSVLKESPSEAYNSLAKRLGKYTLKQTLIRLAHFKAFCGDHSWNEWIKQNANLFKNAYEHKVIGKSPEEVKEAIERMTNDYAKRLALMLLRSGLRISEAKNYDGSGTVIGKGGKARPYLGKEYIKFDMPVNTFRYHLKKVGLKPHDLRKTCLTELARQGLRPEDLCYVAGWSDIKVGYRYLQPVGDNDIKKKLESI